MLLLPQQQQQFTEVAMKLLLYRTLARREAEVEHADYRGPQTPLSLDHTGPLLVVPLPLFTHVCGLCVACVWPVCGLCVACVWPVCGLRVAFVSHLCRMRTSC